MLSPSSLGLVEPEVVFLAVRLAADASNADEAGLLDMSASSLDDDGRGKIGLLRSRACERRRLLVFPARRIASGSDRGSRALVSEFPQVVIHRRQDSSWVSAVEKEKKIGQN